MDAMTATRTREVAMAKTRTDLTHEVQGPPEHVVDLTGDPQAHRLLTVREVAERLSVSTKTVYRLKDERVAFIKVRGSLRFREQDVAAAGIPRSCHTRYLR
jgi:excisionase family DNA binding protein